MRISTFIAAIAAALIVFVLPISSLAATAMSKDLGERVAVDRISSTVYPKVKLATGADGTALDISPSNPLPVSATMSSSPVLQYLDTNPVLDASSTNIPGSGGSALTVVASLNQNVSTLLVNDTTGEFIGVYDNAASTPTCIIGPGAVPGDRIPCPIASGHAVKLKSMGATDIVDGDLLIQFT